MAMNREGGGGDDDILFIEEIKPNSAKTPCKKRRQRTVNHLRPIDSNAIDQVNMKPSYPLFNDMKDFGLKNLSISSPQVANKKNSNSKKFSSNSSDSSDDIIELDSDSNDSVKFESIYFKSEIDAKNAYQENKLNELIASLKKQHHSKTNRSHAPKEEIVHDPNQLQVEFNEDAETAIPVETYITYEPKKLKLGMSHPDQVVETSSLASVEPPEIFYKLNMPKEVYENSKLSALQLEAVVYACQAHERNLVSGYRCGFFIGDGAGVGKGRTIAGIILENILSNRNKAIWVSISSDLKLDAQRDLNDIGVCKDFQVKWLNDFDYKPINMKKGILFTTYSSLIAKKKKPSKGEFSTRLDQIINWAGGENFEGLIIFDESHKAKNLEPENGKPTQVGMTVRDIQEKLPNARVVYASATGASESKNLAYMSRLGLWGPGQPFKDLGAFIEFVEEHGVSSMEVVALDLKWQGIFLARQLSFSGATFEIREVDLDLNFQIIYDKSVKLWVKLKNYIMDFQNLMNYKERSMWANFWAAHQRFFRYLCIASKINTAVQITKEAVKQGKSVVIGLQSTGEAQSVKLAQNKSDNEIGSTAYGVICDVLANLNSPHGEKSNNVESDNEEYYNPRPKKKFKTSTKKGRAEAAKEANALAKSNDLKKLHQDWNELNEDIKNLKAHLPANSLDQLINDLGGPDKVAEMTGRKSHIVCNEYESESENDSEDTDKENVFKVNKRSGSVKRKYTFEKRSTTSQKMQNIDEKNLFMDGAKKIAIISDAASCGISLHASNEAINKSKRLHITLELPWSADKAVQQFGRTHRSNQASAPDYMFLISKLAGEKRFASSVAKRIESMNALTHGDRNATKARDLSSFNLEGKHGNKAVIKVVESINSEKPIETLSLPEYHGDFYEDAKRGLDGIEIGTMNSLKGCNVKTFLNRILGCEVKIQNTLFEYFELALENEIMLAKKENRFDEGINEIDLSKKDIVGEKSETFVLKDDRKIDLHSISVKAGMPWSEVMEIYKNNVNDGSSEINGFYFQYSNSIPVLAIKASNGLGKYMIFSPTHGKFNNRIYKEELSQNYKKAHKMNLVESAWNSSYQTTHVLYVHILGGSILGIFLKIKEIFNGNYKLRICRVYTGQNKRVIGISVPGVLLSRVEAEIKLLLK